MGLFALLDRSRYVANLSDVPPSDTAKLNEEKEELLRYSRT